MSDRKHPVAGYVFDGQGTIIRNFSPLTPEASVLENMIDVIDIGKGLGREPRIGGKGGTDLSYLGPINNDRALCMYSTDPRMTYQKFGRYVDWMKFLYSRRL